MQADFNALSQLNIEGSLEMLTRHLDRVLTVTTPLDQKYFTGALYDALESFAEKTSKAIARKLPVPPAVVSLFDHLQALDTAQYQDSAYVVATLREHLPAAANHMPTVLRRNPFSPRQ
jgi:hypothetical protein